jgi:hypothetical protein
VGDICVASVSVSVAQAEVAAVAQRSMETQLALATVAETEELRAAALARTESSAQHRRNEAELRAVSRLDILRLFLSALI